VNIVLDTLSPAPPPPPPGIDPEFPSNVLFPPFPPIPPPAGAAPAVIVDHVAAPDVPFAAVPAEDPPGPPRPVLLFLPAPPRPPENFVVPTPLPAAPPLPPAAPETRVPEIPPAPPLANKTDVLSNHESPPAVPFKAVPVPPVPTLTV